MDRYEEDTGAEWRPCYDKSSRSQSVMMRESNAWAAKQGVNSENYQHCYHANLSQLHSLSRDFKMQLKAGGGYFILHKMWQRNNFPSETCCFSRNLQELPV